MPFYSRNSDQENWGKQFDRKKWNHRFLWYQENGLIKEKISGKIIKMLKQEGVSCSEWARHTDLWNKNIEWNEMEWKNTIL